MLPADSILRVPYTPDLTLAGIEYACRSLAHTYDRMGGSPFDRLRRIVAGKAAELAFRRLLDARCVPFDTRGETPFTDPDRYDVALGGHRCDLKSFLIYQKDKIRRARRSPTALLEAEALVPADQLESGHFGQDDLYIFGFVCGLLAAHSQETQRAIAAGQPVCLLQTLPSKWARPAQWQKLGRVAIKSEADALTLEVGGQGPEREFITETVELHPGKQEFLRQPFFSLFYVRGASPHGIAALPSARVGIHTPGLDHTLLIEPRDWGNIWVYGMDVFLTGWMRREEFRQKAHLLAAGSLTWQYARTRTVNYALPLTALHPLEALFEQVKRWEARRPMT